MAITSYGEFLLQHGGIASSTPADVGERGRLNAFIGIVAEQMGLPAVINPASAELSARNLFDAITAARAAMSAKTSTPVPAGIRVDETMQPAPAMLLTSTTTGPVTVIGDTGAHPIPATGVPTVYTSTGGGGSLTTATYTSSGINNTGGELIPQAAAPKEEPKSLWPIVIAALALMGNF